MGQRENYYHVTGDGSLIFTSTDILETSWERKMAAYFPLFGRAVHDPRALDRIISKYHLDRVSLDTISLSVRSTGCLRRAELRVLSDLLMTCPQQLFTIKSFGKKSLDELRDIALEILGCQS